MKKIINKKKKSFDFNKIKDIFLYNVKHPILYLKKAYKSVKDYVLLNKYFCLFVLINLANGILLRVFTLGGLNTLFSFPPFIADTSFLLITGAIGYLMNQKKQIIYYIILSFVLVALCTINSSYYTFYTSFASVSLIKTSRFVFAVGNAVVENVIKARDLIYPFLFVVLVVLFIRFSKKKKYDLASKKKALITFIVGALGVGIYCLTLTGAAITGLTKQWNREYVVSRYGIYVYHLNDFIKTVGPKLGSLVGYDKAVKTFNEYYENHPHEVKKNEYTNIFEGKNVIGIHAESIQNFLINYKINGVEVTPNLNKLIKESLYFDNFYSQVSVGTSSDTEFTLATSLMPSSNGTAFGNYFDRKYVTIQKLLKEKGYYTFSMHGNNADYWNRRVMHKNLGYDHFYAKAEFNIDETIGLGLSDISFFKQAVEKLKVINAENKNWYGTFISLTNHTPFSETEKYGELDVSKTIDGVKYNYLEGTKLGNYLKSAHYADKALGIFFEELEKNGLLDNTVIVLYGDHDARLPINDYKKMYNYDPETNGILSEDDENYVPFDNYDYELNRKVPLIIWSKDITPKTVSGVMGMYDLMPTLGNMLGIDNKYALGRDIFNHLEDNIVVFPTGNWLTNKVYYNSQKNEYLVLKGSIIDKEYIAEHDKYATDLLSTSNVIIVYDLIKNTTEKKVDESKVLGG